MNYYNANDNANMNPDPSPCLWLSAGGLVRDKPPLGYFHTAQNGTGYRPLSTCSFGANHISREASNRVLREFSQYQDYFLRVTFCEEDGEQFMHEPRVNSVCCCNQLLSDYAVVSDGLFFSS
jgi:hypothetical protein